MLQIEKSDVIVENPYFQRKSSKQRGCQIDYLIQTRFGTLYVFEMKFSKQTIGCEVIEEVQKKIDSLSAPKGTSFRPVLIHVNGVSQTLIDEAYFAEIIDIRELFDD